MMVQVTSKFLILLIICICCRVPAYANGYSPVPPKVTIDVYDQLLKEPSVTDINLFFQLIIAYPDLYAVIYDKPDWERGISRMEEIRLRRMRIPSGPEFIIVHLLPNDHTLPWLQEKQQHGTLLEQLTAKRLIDLINKDDLYLRLHRQFHTMSLDKRLMGVSPLVNGAQPDDLPFDLQIPVILWMAKNNYLWSGYSNEWFSGVEPIIPPLQRPEAIPFLMSALRGSPTATQRALAATMLTSIDDPCVVEILLASLEEDGLDGPTRLDISMNGFQLADYINAKALADATVTRRWICRMLGRKKDARAIPALVTVVSNRQEAKATSHEALWALVGIGEKNRDQVLVILEEMAKTNTNPQVDINRAIEVVKKIP